MKEFSFCKTDKNVSLKTVLAFVLMLLIIFLPLLNYEIQSRRKAEARARIGFAQNIVINMDRLSAIARKMKYAGADIENNYLPEIKTYIYALEQLNTACADVFGEKYMPIESGYMRHLTSSVYELERKYAMGVNAFESENAVIYYLEKLPDIMDTRFTEETDIIPSDMR